MALAARGRMLQLNASRERRRANRGVTLIEVLIVVAIMALVAGAVAVAVLPGWVGGQKDVAATNARTIRGAVKTWWMHHDPSTCPQIEELITDGVLDRDSPRTDPWGNAWRIECANQDSTIISPGPDRRTGTTDDIRIPPA